VHKEEEKMVTGGRSATEIGALELAQVFPQRALTFIYKIILAEQLVPATRPAQERNSQTQAAFLRQLQMERRFVRLL
jgi:hypothetical protein